MLGALKVTGSGGEPVSLGEWGYYAFLSIFQPVNASLAFAISFILVWLFLIWLLYRKKIYIRV
jgi:predicted acyltransferase